MQVLSTFAIIVALIVIGRWLSWRAMVPDNAATTLNLVVLNVCLPAAILLYAPSLTFDAQLAALVAVPWLLLVAAIVFVLACARVFGFDRGSRANLLLQVPLGNTSFLGYPLIPVLVGADALRHAIAYDQFGSFLILTTFGLMVVAIHAGGQRPGLADIGLRLLKFPPFIALLVALTVMPAKPPEAVVRGLTLLSDALLPMVVMAAGMQLKLRPPRQHRLPLLLGLIGKLVLMPALAFVLVRLLDLPHEVGLTAIYLAAMPPMMSSGALLAAADLEPELSAALIGYGLLASMLTLPMWALLLGG